MTNNLTLYYFHGSYFSQRALIALAEKGVPFKSNVISLENDENFQPWYLKLNPKGQVPCLVDGVKSIPDSSDIIDYLEDNFTGSGDAQPRLLPNKTTSQFRTCKHWRKTIDQVPIENLSFGCIVNPGYMKNPTFPKFALEKLRKARLGNSKQKDIERLMKKYPETRAFFEEKLATIKERAVLDKETMESIFANIDKMMTDLNAHLKEKLWMCGGEFTVTDIYVGVFLNRAHMLGLSERFWAGVTGREAITAYHKRINQRPSFVKHTPTFSNTMLVPAFVKVATPVFVAAVAAVAVYFFIKKRSK